MNSCTKNVRHFTPRMTKLLAEELADYDKIEISITGGGEPLLSPYLASNVKYLRKKLGRRFHFNVVTSGFLPKEKFEKRQLGALLKKFSKGEIFIPALSFNLFSPSFPERLRNTLCFIAENSKLRRVAIKLCSSTDILMDTYEKLDDVFSKMHRENEAWIHPVLAYSYPDPPHDKPLPVIADDFFTTTIWSEHRHEVLEGSAHLYPSIYHMYACDYRRALSLEVKPFLIRRYGRARQNIHKDYAPKIHRCQILNDFGYPPKLDVMDISFDGHYIPDCKCPRDHSTSLGQLGKVSLQEALRRKNEFMQKMPGYLLMDRRNFDPLDLCTMCQQLKAEHFDF